MTSTPYNTLAADFKDRRVLIFGLGVLGSSVGVAQLLARFGCHLRITDLKSADLLQASLNKLKSVQATYVLGEHRAQDIDWAQIIVRGAAVPWHHPLLTRARSQGKPIVMDVQLFLYYAREVKTIGVTGTRGKTTTTHLIHNLCERFSNKTVLLGGNVQDIATLPLLEKISHPSATLAILELSSWQLQACAAHHLSPNLAVLTNLFPDHLNSYPSLKVYYQDKQAIFLDQTAKDSVFFNSMVPAFKTWAKKAKSQVHWYAASDLPASLKLTLIGQHNRQNAAAAYAVANFLHFPQSPVLDQIAAFKPLPHRLSQVRIFQGVTYINDTTATTPVATQTALTSLPRPPIIIVGGSDKSLPIKDLIVALNTHAKKIILLSGNGTDRLKPHLNQSLITLETTNLQTAVAQAAVQAQTGDTVLFSPAFTSFGLFANEYDRGDQFVKAVQQL